MALRSDVLTWAPAWIWAAPVSPTLLSREGERSGDEKERRYKAMKKSSLRAQKTKRTQTTSGSRSAVDVHSCGGGLGHGKTKNSLWNQIKTRDLNAMEGEDRKPLASAPVSHGNQEYGYRQDQNQSHIYTGTSGGESAGYYGGGGSGSSERQESRPSYDRPSYDRPNYDQPPPQQSYGQQGYGGPPPGQYGGPPPGQYGGPPPGQYGGPPPAQYGGPPPGQYGAPQGYGGPPPQQQYGGGYQQPPPPQGYGQPPPPHYGGGGWSQYPGQGRH
ncbi:hypothetical protein BN1723_016637 [Verticillium longisporum]|uniref:Uncharacterized protein n=1 Tax=Verticillium longisporum TaxID=100787 RepID=A0A0G4NHX8_VERLO|nr:hypothetical protein BN1723_016637 [Verticillium longisporum]